MTAAATEYVRAGFALVSIPRGAKGPCTTGWQREKNVIRTEQAAAEMSGNIGLAHRWCGTCAIDVDDYQRAHAWLADQGVALDQLLAASDAVQIRSGRPNRAKLLYRLPPGVAWLPTYKPDDVGIELRCASRDGSSTVQDVLPPSIHPDTGRPYEWSGDWRALPALPDPLLTLWRKLAAPAEKPRDAARGRSKTQQGARNSHLASLAGSMRRRGMDKGAILAALLAENQAHCDPPLSDHEVHQIAESVGRYAPEAEQATGDHWPAPLDLADLLSRDPVSPRMIIDDWLPAGYATLIAGHGGTGKSSIALTMAACIASGRDFFGLPLLSRRVLYLSCEDRADVLHWRLARVCAHMDLAPDDLAGRLHLMDLVGHDAVLWQRDPTTGISATPSYAALQRLMTETGAEILIVDGVSDAYGGSENDRAEIKRFVNALVALIPLTGAVMLIHHINRATAGNGATTEGYSGSTGWHNSVRARWYLHAETTPTDDGPEPTGDLLLDLQKSNLGRADRSMRLRWDDDARMFIGEAVAIARTDTGARDQIERDAIVAALADVEARGAYCPAATTGHRTGYHVLAATGLLPPSLSGQGRGVTKRFWRHIEAMRRMATLRDSSIRTPGHRPVAVITRKPAPDIAPRECANAEKLHSPHLAQGAHRANAPMAQGVIGGCARTFGEDAAPLVTVEI